MRERLKEAPAQEMVRYLIEPAIKGDLERSYNSILKVSNAHIVMLIDENIIAVETGRQILAVLRDLAGNGRSSIEIDPNLECLYFNIESHINKKIGIAIGGQQHTGRSRNDLTATVAKLVTRDYYFRLMQLLNELRSTLIQFSMDKLDVMMSGYTHLQPSEPISLAHYMSAVLNALQRDYERLGDAYRRLNDCPLGAGAMAATSFPINRKLTASLLGFDRPTNNSLDSVASRDYVLELLSAFGIMANNLSRLSHDLYLWSAPEFGYIEVGDSVAVCSSIMPQKKNPISLEHVKAKAAHIEAVFVSAFSCLKNTPYTHCRDVASETLKLYWQALDEIEASIHLMTATIRTIKVNRALMLSRAKTNYCTVTELANYLVRYDKLPFRSAHELVAEVVSHLMEQQLPADAINQEVISKFSFALFNKDTSLSDQQIRRAIDPIQNVCTKSVTGGPAPREVERQLIELGNCLQADSIELSERLARTKEASKLLDARVKALLTCND